MKKRPTVQEVFFNRLPVCPEQDALEAQFFRSLILPNGTFKTTSPNRLDDLNAFVLRYLQEIPDRPLKIMDVAASSGVSTVEWYEHLRSHGIPCDITATDATVHAILMTNGSSLAMLVDRHQNILHMEVFGIGIIGRAKRIRRIPLWILGTAVTAIFKAKTMLGTRPEADHVALLSKRFSQTSCLRMLEDDLSHTNRPDFLQSFHVIRAANILNCAYFPADILAKFVAIIRERLKENGLLIICRTEHTGKNNATIFRATPNGGFDRIARFNDGSEVESIIERGK